MIQLTHIDGKSFFLNSEIIQLIETIPDTLVVLTTGDKLVVKETVEEVVDRIVQFRRRIIDAEAAMNVIHHSYMPQDSRGGSL